MLQEVSEVSGDIYGNGNVHPFEELHIILDFYLAILIITVDSVCTKCQVLGRAHQCSINTTYYLIESSYSS